MFPSLVESRFIFRGSRGTGAIRIANRHGHVANGGTFTCATAIWRLKHELVRRPYIGSARPVANMTRAMLTALRLIIGVASGIAMVAIGTGAQRRIAEQLENVGTNCLVIRPGSVPHGEVCTGVGGKTSLTLADAQGIAGCPMWSTSPQACGTPPSCAIGARIGEPPSTA